MKLTYVILRIQICYKVTRIVVYLPVTSLPTADLSFLVRVMLGGEQADPAVYEQPFLRVDDIEPNAG